MVGVCRVNVLDQYLTDDVALYNGDAADVLQGLPDASIDFSVFSPPFQSLYTYSPSERDLGNSATPETFWEHFGFVSRELVRVVKPGRNVACHVAQVTKTKATHGVIGLFDFRGETIRHFESAGFTYYGEVCIDKDPQAQAIRTHSKALLFTQFHKDSSWSRPALADYILLFKAPGENAVPIIPDLTNNEWIEYARPIWYGIRETETLNVVEAREQEDERHICPLQLGTIERCVKLWSNAGETVLSPFAGIGSELYQSVKLKRKAIGIELKPTYYTVAIRNLKRAESSNAELPLFASIAAD
jgi:DNA modification methylase